MRSYIRPGFPGREGEGPRTGRKHLGTDGSVHAATGGSVLSRAIVAPWDGFVSPRVFAAFRVGAALLLAAFAGRAADLPYYSVTSADGGAWPKILESIGLERRATNVARVVVVRGGTAEAGDWARRVDGGVILGLEGESALAESFGFRRSGKTARVNSVTDVHGPELAIIWEKGADLPVFTVPAGARVFARERWTGAPLLAGFQSGRGAVLWAATDPGERGYERFPYLLQGFADLGLVAPYRSSRLWAFFDSAYRSRVDVDYFAARWRAAGISTLHVAAWHFYEADGEQDKYLARLIEACHREGILVYAWLDLPHVSEKFWADHPEWREKTGLRQDAQLDWRKLMNLTNRDCFRAVAKGVGQLVDRFDWDGVNLAELYFESLEGLDNSARFTPMNDDVRAMFRKQQGGFDPLELFGSRKDAASRRLFLDFRRGLVQRMQAEWIGELEAVRARKRDLDLVLTHVDDRFDPRMQDAIGADTAKVLPLLEKHRFTFLVEDPATVWNLGAERYAAIAGQYRALTSREGELGIDINIVDRYQDVYPTKQQTGVELFELVHAAAGSFARVALYFEASLLGPDLALLPAAGSAVRGMEASGGGVRVDSAVPVGVAWHGAARVDGHAWPAWDGETVWLPAGVHTVEACETGGPRLLRLNGELKSAGLAGAGEIEFGYESTGRAIAVLDRAVRSLRVDGVAETARTAGPNAVLLPGGQHFVTIGTD